MLKKKIAHLKNIIAQPQIDLSKVVNYFLDHLVHDEQFNLAGKAIHKPSELYWTILSVAGQQCDAELIKERSLLVQVKEYHMMHGAVQFSNLGPGLVLFFDDIKTGVVAVSTDDWGMTSFIRLTTYFTDKADRLAVTVTTGPSVH